MGAKAGAAEAMWHGLFEYAAREENPDKLREVVMNINRLLTVVERRLAEIEDKSRSQS
jgi:hypothetical protein